MTIKKHFKSRFDGGVIVEIDYSQLEVIGLATLSKDPALIKDLRSGIDIHSRNTADLFPEKYPGGYEQVKDSVDRNELSVLKDRKIAKAFSFQLQYGSGAKNMAETNNVSVDLAKKFIEQYYNRYAVVKQWQDRNIEIVKQNRIPHPTRVTAAKYPVEVSKLGSLTGREYTFFTTDAPGWKYTEAEPTCFVDTQIKNYPVQGFSTGDVVPLALGKMFRHLVDVNGLADWLPICTQHDSIISDVRSVDIMRSYIGGIRQVLVEQVPTDLYNLWGIKLPVSLKVDIEYGPNWDNMQTLNLS